MFSISQNQHSQWIATFSVPSPGTTASVVEALPVCHPCGRAEAANGLRKLPKLLSWCKQLGLSRVMRIPQNG